MAKTLEEVIDRILKAYDPAHGNKEIEELIEREKAKSWRAGHDVGYRSGQRHFQRELRAIFGIKQPDDDD